MNVVPVLASDEIQEDRPMPSRNHARVAQSLGALLHVSRAPFDIYQQLSLDLDGWATIPDICAYPTGTLSNDLANDEDVCTIAPALVIEILSPKQNLQPLLDKVRQYLARGVRSCWVVIPGTATVSVFPANGGSRSFVDGDVEDAVLGLRLPMAGIFA
jgi:Uma2 family endonuclease